jgi:hypothetical protein
MMHKFTTILISLLGLQVPMLAHGADAGPVPSAIKIRSAAQRANLQSCGSAIAMRTAIS